jgi:prephenate dehydratase
MIGTFWRQHSEQKTMSLKIAIQGAKASFHEEAAFKFFGREVEIVECDSFKKS